ncbi:thioesterase II family protein [Streptomyces sp. NPDC049040]|uniref:thioesterase II family protein n=1 Tax=Streptomyces sp. NPDC049040 TaxID=3365593 RepID=UPI0037136151
MNEDFSQPAVRMCEYSADPAAHTVLYCFTHAGGAAPFFRPWAACLPPGVALCVIQPPGRQDMMRFPPFPDMAALADATARAIEGHLRGRRHVFFGHSMGALTAFETARRLRRAGLPEPDLLGVSACPAPHLGPDGPPVRDLSDEQLLARVTALGGLEPELLASQELVALMLPAIRADFEILDGYAYVAEPPLGCGLAVFGGLSDDSVPGESLRAWDGHALGRTVFQLYPGGHFYLDDAKAGILDVMLAPGQAGLLDLDRQAIDR